MAIQTFRSRRTAVTISLFILIVLVVVAVAVYDRWLPQLRLAVQSAAPGSTSAAGQEDHDHGDHEHEEHDHDHGDGQSTSIALSERGLRNIGFESLVIEPTQYTRMLTLPAIIVERPGRSQLHITAPLTGVVGKIHAVTGEAVGPDDPLFELRLTHEELVASQRQFLETSATLNVVQREIDRLEGLGEGVVAGRRVLEQQYEKQKLEAALFAAEQAMLLHGLNEEQVQRIRETGELFHNITIRAPEHTDTEEACEGPHLFTLQRLPVALGEHVQMGQELAMLADHCELHIEALAFEDDAERIRAAAEANRPVTARLLDSNSPGSRLTGLQILYVASQIDPESRAFKAYLRLPNQVALDKEMPNGKRFLEWVYKPGQRMQVGVPVESWENQLVLPTTAVVDEGAEAYVYRQNGSLFEQVPVHVLHRDQGSVVIANDGALFPGDVIAAQGAYQIHLALKNQAGGGIDPHAGHSH